MQEQPDKEETNEPEVEPLSSEAPDTLQPAEAQPITPVDPEAAEVLDPSIQEEAPADSITEPTEAIAADGDSAPDAAEPAEAAAEQPDGEVTSEADDLVTEANAVDPKIDVGLLEAYLFSTSSPLTPGRLGELFSLESTKPIRKAIRILNEQYEATGRCFRVEQVAGGFQLLTLPVYGDHLKALHQREADAKLTKAALETLSIIAYKQPILRADVEAIRGVASGETIRSLMEKHLVKIAGRAEEPGRPILYGTTKRFLEVFGLNTLKDLPQPDSPQAKARQLAQAAQALLSDPDGPQAQPPTEQAGDAATEAPAETEAPAPELPADQAADLATTDAAPAEPEALLPEPEETAGSTPEETLDEQTAEETAPDELPAEEPAEPEAPPAEDTPAESTDGDDAADDQDKREPSAE